MKRWRNVGIVVFATWFVAQGTVSSAAAQEQRTRPKVGLVLSGGGARGAAHIGVLKVLEQEGIPIDYIAGTSFGAIVGALYALGYSPEEIEGIILTQDWNELFDDSPNRRLAPLVQDKSMRYMTRLDFLGSSPQLPTGILRGQKLAAIVSRYTTDRMIAADYDFDRLRIPFRAVATDILTGRPYVFKQGAMSEALRASISMPAIFTPVEKDDMLLVDGGLSDNLPCDVVKEMGADIIIAVDTTSPLYSKGQMQSLFKVLDQSVALLMKRSVEENLRMSSLTIRPDLEPYTYGSYGQLREIMKKGELAAQEKREEMLVLFPITDRLSAPPREVLPRKSTIDSIAFSGLSKVKDREVRKEIHNRPGDLVDPTILASDLERLYALRLFDAVTYSTERVAEDRHRLTYRFKEAAGRTIGASLRYDQDYKFVVLGEFNARTLFGTPSSATLSGQFGGLENHSASLRLVHPRFSNVFLEPSIHLQKQERYDVRGGNLMDTYLDRRVGSQVMFGATFYKRFEASAGYRIEQVKIRGGSAPNRQESAQNLAGVRLRLRRDTLDHQEFARRGMKMDLQLDRRGESFGSSSNHTTVQGDIQRLIPISEESTLQVRASGFFTRGDLPFYARAFVGGQSFAEMASRQFIGFGKDEVAARQFALLGASYRRQVFASPAGFLRRGYVSADYNVIGSSERKAFMDGYRYQHGAGIGFSMLTPVAPIRVASGWSAGTVKVYVTIGPSF